ncbi:MAG: flagellar basal-body rod protein FlgG [Candidatus Margulisbacteria bacterium GWF2_35_9]|nr:MAG: flagellar basal-body rod protein FlgG [Candidatus Margulisbacteria bacterium GWF2_35_9]
MSRSMWIAATGMMAQQMNIDVISNNLANVNTVGFKKSRADFEDLMYQKINTSQMGAEGKEAESIPLQIGLGVRSVGVPKIYTEGALNQTNRDLDIAIEGDGFFQVQMPDGDMGYTRAGNFKKDSDGYLVTPDGFVLSPAIQIPDDVQSVFISAEGRVTASKVGETVSIEIGQIQLVAFPNPTGLENVGRNIVKQTGASGEPMIDNPGVAGIGTVSQGYLENSNVDIAEEMIKMIIAQRAYEINSKAIQSSDEMMSLANNLKRG